MLYWERRFQYITSRFSNYFVSPRTAFGNRANSNRTTMRARIEYLNKRVTEQMNRRRKRIKRAGNVSLGDLCDGHALLRENRDHVVVQTARPSDPHSNWLLHREGLQPSPTPLSFHCIQSGFSRRFSRSIDSIRSISPVSSSTSRAVRFTSMCSRLLERGMGTIPSFPSS